MTTPNTKQWYIFRHGLATRSLNGYGDTILTAEVLPEGIAPVRRLGAHLKSFPYDIGMRSEFIRCQQTAAIVSEITGRAFTPDGRLNEKYQETFGQVKVRVEQFIADMQATPHQNIWVCTHGAVIAALKHLLTRGEHSEAFEMDYIQPGELLVVRGTDAEVVRLDDVI